MKKKIASLLLWSMYFFGGFGIVGATVVFPDGTTVGSTHSPATIGGVPLVDTPTPAQGSTIPATSNPAGTMTVANPSGLVAPGATVGGTTGGPTPSGGRDDMTSTDFTLNPNDLSPSEKKYTGGTKTNFKTLLANIGKYLLIATTTIAVLSIVIGGLMISTTGPTDRAAKGKTIIMLNIMAVVVALFSYSIIQLVSWLIA
ncbi:MAG: hypothetical protein PHN60_04435 [Candidatus Gracilibacteria bacterium]|nr:hypothetical protein [Candidatus Gracilibacteria bacterium]